MDVQTNTNQIALSLTCTYFRHTHAFSAEAATLNIFTNDRISLVDYSGETLFDCPFSEVKRMGVVSPSLIITLTNGSRFSLSLDKDAEAHAVQSVIVSLGSLGASKLEGGIVSKGAEIITYVVTAAWLFKILRLYIHIDFKILLPLLRFVKSKGVTVYRISLFKTLVLAPVIGFSFAVWIVALIEGVEAAYDIRSFLLMASLIGWIAYPYFRIYR